MISHEKIVAIIKMVEDEKQKLGFDRKTGCDARLLYELTRAGVDEMEFQNGVRREGNALIIADLIVLVIQDMGQ